MSSRSATPASMPSLVNHRLASLLMVLEAPPTTNAALDVVEEWAQDLSPLMLAYRKALGAIRDEETELRVAAAARGDWPELVTAIDAEVERRAEEQKRLAKEEARHVKEAVKHEEDRRRQAAEDERRAQEATDEELAKIAAAEGLLDKGKGRARVDEEVAELSDDPSIKTPRTVELRDAYSKLGTVVPMPLPLGRTQVVSAAIVKRQAGQKFQQGCYFDKVSVLGKTKKTRGGGSTTKKRIRLTSPGPSVADSSGSKKRRVDEPPRPLLRLPLDGAGRLGLEQDNLDALDLDDESQGIIRVIREECAFITCHRALLHDMDLNL
ncbi:predicted protein [Postia placenta Mad-698-R]|nr:predicted protein [Postia placenta Mad-698-R]